MGRRRQTGFFEDLGRMIGPTIGTQERKADRTAGAMVLFFGFLFLPLVLLFSDSSESNHSRGPLSYVWDTVSDLSFPANLVFAVFGFPIAFWLTFGGYILIGVFLIGCVVYWRHLTRQENLQKAADEALVIASKPNAIEEL